MARYDQEWVDGQLMGLDEPLPHIRAEVPLICRPSSTNQRELPDDCAPGLYLKSFAIRTSGSAGIHVEFGEAREGLRFRGTLLTPDEAREHAGFWDRVTSPRRCARCRIDDERVAAGVVIPDTFRELVDAWYAALGRRLDMAIEQAETKRTMLREVRAALTGRAG